MCFRRRLCRTGRAVCADYIRFLRELMARFLSIPQRRNSRLYFCFVDRWPGVGVGAHVGKSGGFLGAADDGHSAGAGSCLETAET